jgi:hypothetical protein
VIDDLDHAIEQLLQHELPSELTASVAISFAAPDDKFPPPAVALPAIDIFLYDVRENRDLRDASWQIDRALDGVTRRAPTVRVDCSYLVTAWASDSSPTRAFDEHRMLGDVIRALLRYPTLPEAVLGGELADQQPPLPTCTLQSGRLQSMGEFWQALGGKPKAAVHYTVTVGVEPGDAVVLGPPVVDTLVTMRSQSQVDG